MYGPTIEKIEYELSNGEKITTIYTVLPAQGFTKPQLLEAFVNDLAGAVRQVDHLADDILGGTVRLNGRMTTEMALAAGAIAARLGAKRVELFDPSAGEYVPVLGEGSPLAMPVPLLPGMIVEIVSDGGLFRQGATAEIINVGKDSVNIAEKRNGVYRGRRDTGWTRASNVRPVGWGERPVLT